MADFYRLNVAVSSHQGILDAIEAFVISAAPGPAWTAAAMGPGEAFFETSGVTKCYPYLWTTGANRMVHAGLTTCSAATSGFAGATVTTATLNAAEDEGYYGMGLWYNASGTKVTGNKAVMHFFGNEDRVIILLRNEFGGAHQMLYLGLYTPHCAALDDTCPQIVVGNSPAMIYMTELTSSSAAQYSVPIYNTSTPEEHWMSFPFGVLKSSPLTMSTQPERRYYVKQRFANLRPEDAFCASPDVTANIPLNNRAAPTELFFYQQYLMFAENGRGEGATLDGIFRSSDDQALESTITVGADDYFIWPTSLQPSARPRVFAIGPMGTIVP